MSEVERMRFNYLAPAPGEVFELRGETFICKETRGIPYINERIYCWLCAFHKRPDLCSAVCCYPNNRADGRWVNFKRYDCSKCIFNKPEYREGCMLYECSGTLEREEGGSHED